MFDTIDMSTVLVISVSIADARVVILQRILKIYSGF